MPASCGRAAWAPPLARVGRRRQRGAAERGLPEPEEGQSSPAAQLGPSTKLCYEMRDTGACARGDACRFSHDRALLAESRRALESDAGGGGTGPRAPVCLQFLRGACSLSERECNFNHSDAPAIIAAVREGAVAAGVQLLGGGDAAAPPLAPPGLSLAVASASGARGRGGGSSRIEKIYVAPQTGKKFHLFRGCGGLMQANEVKTYERCQVCG